MGLKRIDRELLEKFIVENVEKHPKDIVTLTATTFTLSRQAVSYHIKKLTKSNVLISEGDTKGTRYSLKEKMHVFPIKVTANLREDEVWRSNVLPVLPKVVKNVLDICCYGITEMINNVIDHSESDSAEIFIKFNALKVSFLIYDHGVGIFNKIQKALKLSDPRHAILELAKGKLTTDPKNHTGEGIFFTSRMFDNFDILSEHIYFHGQKDDDWLLDKEKYSKGTAVFMDISRNSRRTTEQIFKDYASKKDGYGFTKTKVPVKLLKYEGEELVSRSQAKRLIARFDRFSEVILDFSGVKKIGRAFADEIFRVYKNKNPKLHLRCVNANDAVRKAIKYILDNQQVLSD